MQCACLHTAVCSFLRDCGEGSSLLPRALTQIHLQHAFSEAEKKACRRWYAGLKLGWKPGSKPEFQVRLC